MGTTVEPRREMLTNDDWDTLELTTSSRGLTYRHETPSAGSEDTSTSGRLDARRLATLTGAPTITGRLSMGRPVFQPVTMLQQVNFATEPDNPEDRWVNGRDIIARERQRIQLAALMGTDRPEPSREVPPMPATGVNAERRATARAIWQTQTAEG